MGRIKASFKADGAETANQYCISEWFFELNTTGPGEQVHDHHDDMFYVIEGVMDIKVDGEWASYSKGSYIMAPAGTPQDFRNSSNERAGLLNFSMESGFEDKMPMIIDWFKANPPQDVE
jgi:mannose-6-phosphate isomerase-like protein (cupin superfamily)